MTRKEIAELAAWTAKSIKDTLTMDGRKLDDAGEDIIREYVQRDLINWQRGEKITLENSTQLVQEIMLQRRHETDTEAEVYNALAVLCSKFPKFVEENQRERDAEAKRLAESMPAFKV
jgi:hypothetical protein